MLPSHDTWAVAHFPSQGIMQTTKFASTNKRNYRYVLFYSSTKEDVDVLEQMCAQYSTKRKSWRWPPCHGSSFHLISQHWTQPSHGRELHLPSALQPSSSRLDRLRQLPIELEQSLTESLMRERATMQQVTCEPKVKDAVERMEIIE